MVLEKERPGVVGFHFYNPPREGKRIGLGPRQTSPDGKDWSETILSESYFPLAEKGIYSFASYDVYSVLLNHELPRIMETYAREGRVEDVAKAEKTIVAMKGSLAENGVASSYSHPILPKEQIIDIRTLARAGYLQFMKDSGGVAPQFLWLPESAIDTKTAEVVVETGYRGILCASHQVRLESGELAGPRPTKLQLPSGNELISLPFHHGSSQAIAFKEKHHAPTFADKYILPAYSEIENDINLPIVIWTDGETLGHHWKRGEFFAEDLLLNVLPNKNVIPTSVNKLEFQNLPKGYLREKTAWSCEHGLSRWDGPCGCCGSNDGKWKTPFDEAHKGVNNALTDFVREQLGKSDEELIDILSMDFGRYIDNPGPPNTDTTISLLSAKVSGLIARTSCGTFFDTPETSGLNNIAFATQAIAHLRDAGPTKKADEIENAYRNKMHEVVDPSNLRRRGTDMIDDLLEKARS